MEKEQIYKLVEFCDNAELLDTLIEDEDINNYYTYLKYHIAKNQKATPKILLKLFGENSDSIFLQVALGKNPNSPREVLEKLIKSNNWEVREAVGSNKNISPDLLEVLSEDDDSDVLSSVAKNINCPINLLKNLSLNKDIFVRNFAKSNPKMQRKVSDKSNLKNKLNGNLSLIPLSDLMSLAKDKNDSIRLSLSNNFTTPSLVLSILSLDPIKEIRDNAILNPNYIDVLLNDFEW